MYYLKNKYFTRWAKKQGIEDNTLIKTIREFEDGLFEATLGNHLYKKRIAISGRGKSGGVRTILFYKKDKKLIFCFGFEKSQQDNLTNDQFNLLNKLSDNYQNTSDGELISDIKDGDLFLIQNRR